ncbi:MAG: hypothetical protein K0R39_2072 [Symbiobacteriaceae bacterium]|jgi:hypothetical protein|nr:hypothetical protein [Symbiobacteriaceae bacterium]
MMSERDIRVRLEGLVDRWIKATPSERIVLVQEKIRLEELLEAARKEEKFA